jgi:endonuclease/exonuclease/phosphatase family metal-dependent hydrolase
MNLSPLTLLAIALLLIGCISQTTNPIPNQTNSTSEISTNTGANNTNASFGNATGQNATPSQSTNLTVTNVTIANFNIQIFGQSKRSKPEVMAVLTHTARRFDIMAVEEFRDETETTIPYYLAQINALPGPEYAVISSPRLGRTSSKENYAFFFNTQTVRLVPGSNYTFQDPSSGTSTDLFQREPFVAHFQVVNGTFDFVLIVIHTEPDGTPQELGYLPLVLTDARNHFPAENDFIMLGDMNADCSYLSQSEAAALQIRNASFVWVVPDSADTTTKSTDCAYDRVILTEGVREDFTGNWGIFRFDNEFNLNQSQTEDVSDHYPVWADFWVANDTD